MDDVVASREIAVRLVQAAERLKDDFAEAVAPFTLSVPAARALLLLDEAAPMRELSDRLACDQSFITRIADELESRGLVQRVPGADRRVQMLKLTRTGVRMRNSVFEAVTANNRVQLRLSRAEREALDRALQRLLPD
jgi:DNA-binding MarR family transcriptional regulator